MAETTPTNKMTRRAFLGAATTALVALGAGGCGVLRRSRPEAAAVVAAMVRQRLDYLTLDEVGLATFATDLLDHLPEASRMQLQQTGTVAPSQGIPYGFSLAPTADAFRPFEDMAAEQYLLSSDFFRRGADATRTVLYVGYYDPYLIRCFNPFTHLG